MTNIDIHYINLDRSSDRRAKVEQSFAESKFSSRWTLTRFAAVDATSPPVLAALGNLNGAYKGNFLSHLGCLRRQVDTDSHLYIAEDDIQFCDKTGPLLEKVIDALGEDTWDIIHPEVSLMSAVEFPRFYKLRRNTTFRNKVRLIALGDFPYAYAGSGSYIVNRKSKRKFLEGLDETVAHAGGKLDVPFDLCLRGLLHYHTLKGFVTVPFLTAPSIHADESSAPYGKEDPNLDRVKRLHLELINAYRRLVWVGFDPEKVMPPELRSEGENIFLLTEQDKLFQKVISWLLFMQYEARYREYDLLRFLEEEVPIV